MSALIGHAWQVERKDWNRLVEALDAWTSAVEIAPDQIEVALGGDGTSRHAVIVMTPDQWNAMAGVMWGDFDNAVEEVKATLLRLQTHEGFAVYSEYRLEPSTTATLPEPTDAPPASGGEWVAYDRAGRIESRFAEWTEAEQQG